LKAFWSKPKNEDDTGFILKSRNLWKTGRNCFFFSFDILGLKDKTDKEKLLDSWDETWI
jgi:hypothetical protein